MTEENKTASTMEIEAVRVPMELFDTQAADSQRRAVALRNEILTVRAIDEVSYQRLGTSLKAAKEMKKSFLDGAFEDVRRSAKQFYDRVLERKSPVIQPLDEVIAHTQTEIVRWDREQQRLKDEEHQRQVEAHQREVDEQNRKIREQQVKDEADRKKREEDARIAEAANAETVGAAPALVNEILERPVEVSTAPPRPIAPPPPPPPPPVKHKSAAGVSTRKNWKGEVVNKMELIRYVAKNPSQQNLLEPNMSAIDNLCKAGEDKTAIPGVRAYNKESTFSRG
jgi:hypothetical protein